MKRIASLSVIIMALAGAPALAHEDSASAALRASTVLDLGDLKKNPGKYAWTDFRPNLKKLILSGAADTEHISILWYTIAKGSVGSHYHAKTESVYAIDGTQSDAKGVYPSGSLYFNPPGSGHAISDSTGFFLLAYASPPDFGKTALIKEYTPVQVDTRSPDFEASHPFREAAPGVKLFTLPLDPAGGMRSEFIRVDANAYQYTGNYLLVVKGSCVIEGTALGADALVVAKTVARQTYKLAAAPGAVCLALGVSF